MLEVAPIENQNRMDTFDFFRQYEIWQKRTKRKNELMQQRNGR